MNTHEAYDIVVCFAIQELGPHAESWWFYLTPQSAAGRDWVENSLPAWAEECLPVEDGCYGGPHLMIRAGYQEPVLTALVADGLTVGVRSPRSLMMRLSTVH